MFPFAASLLFLFAAAVNPFAQPARVRVLVFARTDCPITNRYAPELARIAQEFQQRDVHFWVVYPDRSESQQKMEQHMAEYHLPGQAIKDPDGSLRKRAAATISPQAAVFDRQGKLMYSGRIDDRYVSFGQSRPEPGVHDLENAIAATLDGKPVAQPHTRAIGCYLSDLQ